MDSRHSTEVLKECIALAEKKGKDYQSDSSGIKQADYYPRGVESIYDIMHGKMLRFKSVMSKAKGGNPPNYESLEDTAKDLINYASFMVSYLRGRMEGQKPGHDIFNEPILTKKLDQEEEVTVVVGASGRLTELYSNTVNTALDTERFGPRMRNV